MRHQVAPTLRAVMLCSVFMLPTFLFGQNATAKKPVRSAIKAGKEIVLQAEDGLALPVKTPLKKDRRTPSSRKPDQDAPAPRPVEMPGFRVMTHPREDRLVLGRAFHGDLRTLPQTPPEKFERPEFEEPQSNPVAYPGTSSSSVPGSAAPVVPNVPSVSVPAPSPSNSFEGLDFTNWGAGHPPDTNGDVGPTYYIQTINTSIGIFRKSDGVRVAAFTFNTFMSQGSFGNLCDTNNFGDPVVLYDSFEDRWVITDFAFQLDISGNVIAPQYQCFAVSKSGDPVSGGWNFYSINVVGALGDYPKFGIWPDGLYMSANLFTFGAGSTYQNARVWALNKAQMYAGAPTVQILSFDAPASEFTLLPSNARLQTGTPPAGSPNYFATVFNFTNAVSVYKFHADWNRVSTSTFSGPSIVIAPTSWANPPNTVPGGTGGNAIDTLAVRLMVQNQYTNMGGVESLWNAHTVRGTAVSNAAPRYYQVDVTGGTVAGSTTQASTFNPDASAVNRTMPSVAVDRAGNMAMGYSGSSSTLFPAIRYAGRLAGDAVNTITQTETSLIEGTGTQTGNCGSTCTRWGDYSAMTLDPDGCTFWYTSLYYQISGLAFNTRIGAFSFPGCTSVTSGTLQGTVTDAVSSNPIQGATVMLGSRTATTDVNGNYAFTSLPSGTYSSMTASFAGYVSGSASGLVVSDSLITTQNFALTLASVSGCLTDTAQTDFQAGVPTNCDLTSSAGDVILLNAPNIDQQSTSLGTSGVGITVTTWGGQTFTPAVTGQLTRVDINLFCSGCTGTTPALTLSIRGTSANLPTGADLVSATVSGFSSGASAYYTASFGSPVTLTAGTKYAILIRPTANPSPGTYALTRSGTSTVGSDVYAGGTRVAGATSGTVWSIPTTGGITTDAGFKTYISTGFASSGTFVSSLKDANPAVGLAAHWSTISWTADTPAGTDVQFQVAGSNNAGGPFNFVGPDGTSATFFTSGGSLAQFNGSRYLKYQALLTTNSGAATSTLHDVTLCFNNALTTSLAVSSAAGTYGGTVNLSATLTANIAGVSGKTVSFLLNGSSAGSATTDGSGVATVSNVSLTGISPGSYPSGVSASFAGDAGSSASSNSAALTVSKANQTITFASLGNQPAGAPDFTVSATASSTLAVSFAASGNCTVTGTTVHLTGPGSCTITASQAGDSNYNAAPDVPQSFSIGKTDQTITFGGLSGKIFGDVDFSVSATASSTLSVSFAATGNCTVTGTTVHITGAGSCTITASQAGDATYNPAPDVPQLFAIAKASQVITFGALPGKTFGNPDFTVSATSSSGLAVSFTAGGNCTVTGSTVHLTSAGSCTVTAVQAGNANYNAAASVPQTFAIAGGDDFSVTPTVPSVSVTAGQSVVAHITVSPNPATFTATTFSCSGLPAKASCTFAPNPVPPSSAPTDVVMTISTTATTTAALQRRQPLYLASLGFTSLGLIGMAVIGVCKKARRSIVVLCVLILLVILAVAGCGGSSGTHVPVTVPGTPQGTSTVTVTGSNAGFTHSTTFTLTVN